MGSLHLYLFRQVAAATLFAALVTTVAAGFTQSIHIFKLVVANGIGLATVLKLSVTMTPSLLLICLPISVFVAIVFVYERLIGDQEIVVMRVAGMSHMALAAPALALAAIVAVIAYTISLYVLPISVRSFKDTKHMARYGPALVLREGAFATVAKGLTVYYREKDGDSVLHDVLIFDERDSRMHVVVMAKRSIVTVGDGNVVRVVLIDGNRQEHDVQTDIISVLEFDRTRVAFDLGKGVTPARPPTSAERYVWDLLDPAKARDDPVLRARDLAEGHSRIVGPIYAITFAMIALAGTFLRPPSRAGNYLRLIVMTGAMALVEGGAFGTHAIAVDSAVAVPLIYANAIVPTVGAFWLLRRMDKTVGSPIRVPWLSDRLRALESRR